MNFHWKILFFAFLIHQNLSNGHHGEGIAPPDAASRIAKEISKLGRKLMTSIEADSEPHENLLISPTNIFHAMALLHMAAGGDTLQELSTLIGIPPNRNYSKSDIHSAISGFYKTVGTDDQHPAVLNIADGLFLQEDFKIKKEFQEFAVKQYEAQVENVNFHAGQTTVDKINSWVSERTKGRITKMIDSCSPDTLAVIISTLYFKARWEYPFNKRYTRWGNFSTGKNAVEVQMMSLTQHFPYVNNADLKFESIDLPYDSSDYALNIILPYPTQTIKNLLPKLKDISVTQIMEKSETWKVRVRLPKIKFNVATSLKETFQKFGVHDLFDNANLNDLADKYLRVSKILHMAEIEINEEGTVATGGTAIEILTRSMPRSFHVNRPFIINIYNRKTSLNLFSGVVYKP